MTFTTWSISFILPQTYYLPSRFLYISYVCLPAMVVQLWSSTKHHATVSTWILCTLNLLAMCIGHMTLKDLHDTGLVVASTAVIPEDTTVSVLMVDNANFGLDYGRTEWALVTIGHFLEVVALEAPYTGILWMDGCIRITSIL